MSNTDTATEYGVECNGWGRRHVEWFQTLAAAERRVADGHGNPVLIGPRTTAP